ncbi:MAG: substrate-binding domain-containing protein, partial [Anaerolineaceae bacterium]
LAAARIYDLEFIPICEEEYDLLIAEESLNNPQFQRFMQALQSEELKQRLEAMGGYKLDRPGEMIEL